MRVLSLAGLFIETVAVRRERFCESTRYVEIISYTTM
jgi:hypothetical protein